MVSNFGSVARLLIAGITLALSATLAADPGGSNTFPTPTSGGGTTTTYSDVWRLDLGCTYSTGSGATAVASSRFRGTMNLTALPTTQPGNLPRTYAVSDVNWLVTINGEDVYVSGGGTYQITSSVGMLTVIGNRLQLQLKWGSDSTVRSFDSGVVALSGVMGRSMDVTLHEVASTNTPTPAPGATIRVKAAALPVRALVPYATVAAETEFLQGCYGPCACPLMMQPMTGKFSVVELPNPTASTIGREWALVKAIFTIRTLATNSTTAARTFRGAGIEVLRPGTASNTAQTQRLRANLTDSASAAGQTQRFDSGVVAVTAPWPVIDAAIADHEYFCYNRVLDFQARPVTAVAPIPAPSPTPGPRNTP